MTRTRTTIATRTPIRQCPTCDYDLNGIPPEIAQRLVKGLDFGPRVCPECGTLWPLVPPGIHPTMEPGRW